VHVFLFRESQCGGELGQLPLWHHHVEFQGFWALLPVGAVTYHSPFRHCLFVRYISNIFPFSFQNSNRTFFKYILVWGSG